MASLILTIIGPDRPGLVRALSEAIAARGGSWLESRMARLAGQFAGIVMVEAPESLVADLPALEHEGLRIAATHAGAAEMSAVTGLRLLLEVVGNDRPGIVHDITQILAMRGVNIEELTTQIESTPFSGDPLFRATITLRAPSEETAKTLSAGLERLSNEMMVDIQPLET
jgi:glycine cleavage system regulatory protein